MVLLRWRERFYWIMKVEISDFRGREEVPSPCSADRRQFISGLIRLASSRVVNRLLQRLLLMCASVK